MIRVCTMHQGILNWVYWVKLHNVMHDYQSQVKFNFRTLFVLDSAQFFRILSRAAQCNVFFSCQCVNLCNKHITNEGNIWLRFQNCTSKSLYLYPIDCHWQMSSLPVKLITPLLLMTWWGNVLTIGGLGARAEHTQARNMTPNKCLVCGTCK